MRWSWKCTQFTHGSMLNDCTSGEWLSSRNDWVAFNAPCRIAWDVYVNISTSWLLRCAAGCPSMRKSKENFPGWWWLETFARYQFQTCYTELRRMKMPIDYQVPTSNLMVNFTNWSALLQSTCLHSPLVRWIIYSQPFIIETLQGLSVSVTQH